jgi:hypothetical protein
MGYYHGLSLGTLRNLRKFFEKNSGVETEIWSEESPVIHKQEC